MSFVVDYRWVNVVNYRTVASMVTNQTVVLILALHGLLLTEYIICFYGNVKVQILILIEGVGFDSEQFERRWNAVGDEAEQGV